MTEIGTKVKLLTIYHPQSNGQIERTNQSLKTYLQHYINYSQKKLEPYTNRKRKKKPQLKERNKIYLIKKNLENSQPNKKLNHKKVGFFINKKK